MKAMILCLALLCGCANLKDSAHIATALDAGSTAALVGSGAAIELNPVAVTPGGFIAMMIARVVGTEYVNTLPEPQRTEYLSAMNSAWFGYGISNVAVWLFASNPIGMGVGLFGAAMIWKSTEERRAFAEICAAARQVNPAIVCTYTPT